MKKPTAKALRRSAKKAAPKAAKKKAAPQQPESARQLPQRDLSSMRPFIDLLTNWQIRYIRDRSRLKKLKKSRRIGGTWIQALEDVLDCIETPHLKVWFSSADKSAGTEYIDYVLMWVGVANILVETAQVEESLLDGVTLEAKESLEVADEEEASATVVTFHNGSKITALSSNPSQFRSKGGKVVLDEFAHHKRDRELWKAAQPVALRGHSIRILSTPNGKSCAFYRLGNPDATGKPGGTTPWSNHHVTLRQALDDGMLEQIHGRPCSEEEKQAFIDECRAQCLDEASFLEEFCGQEQDEARSLLPYTMIERVERAGILDYGMTGPLYLGMDVARRRDLTVIYVLELVASVLYTRKVVVLPKTKFAEQKRILWEFLRLPNMYHAAIDSNGIGMQMTEEAQDAFGENRVDGVMMTQADKDALATRLVQEFEDATTLIPADELQRESLHSINRIVGASNRVRYDAAHDEVNGHGDHFWALALAISAARTGQTSAPEAITRPSRDSMSVSTSGFSEFGSFSHSGLDRWSAMK